MNDYSKHQIDYSLNPNYGTDCHGSFKKKNSRYSNKLYQTHQQFNRIISLLFSFLLSFTKISTKWIFSTIKKMIEKGTYKQIQWGSNFRGYANARGQGVINQWHSA